MCIYIYIYIHTYTKDKRDDEGPVVTKRRWGNGDRSVYVDIILIVVLNMIIIITIKQHKYCLFC